MHLKWIRISITYTSYINSQFQLIFDCIKHIIFNILCIGVVMNGGMSIKTLLLLINLWKIINLQGLR